MENERILRELGLSEAEAKVYLALLESGPSAAGGIIKKAGLHRATTYQVFQRLEEKGLVSSVVEGGRRSFMAASPRRLQDTLRQREWALEEAMPALERMQKAAGGRQEITVYSGVAGIRSALDAMLEEVGRGGTYCDFGVSGLFKKTLGPYFYVWQNSKRRMKITSYVIFNESLRPDRQFFREYYGKSRFTPKEHTSLTDTMIYRDTVILLIWTARPPVAVVIRNRENAKSYQSQFWFMWKSAKR